MLRAENLIVGHGGQPVAGPLSFGFADGECVMLCGANGSGKSTLLRTIAGLLKPIGGSLETGGEAVMVPTHIPKVKGFTVREFIRTSLCGGTGIFGRLDKAAEEKVREAVCLLSLDALADKDLSRISDGEFQRVCIATALTRKADVILLDEPTAFLDVDNRLMVLQTLRDIAHGEIGGSLHGSRPTVLFSTHDIYDGERMSDRVLKLTAKQ